MCNSARRHPEDRQGEDRYFPAFPQLARDVLRRDCRSECQAAGVRSFSIPPCCLGSRHENHVADRRMQRGKAGRRSAAQECETRARASQKPRRDEGVRPRAPREIFSAKAREDDRLAVQHAPLSFNTTPKFLRGGLSRYGRFTERPGRLRSIFPLCLSPSEKNHHDNRNQSDASAHLCEQLPVSRIKGQLVLGRNADLASEYAFGECASASILQRLHDATEP